MILYGQYDSPFVRRVAVTLHHYAMPFKRRVLSVFGDFEALRAVNPLGRVPALELADGRLLVESCFILDHLDALAGAEHALTPFGGDLRLEVQQVCAIALGVAEKAVAYRGETLRRAPEKRDAQAVERLEIQIAAGLDWLEARAQGPWISGGRMTQADVTTGVAFTYLSRRYAPLPAGSYPRLRAFSAACEVLAPFAAAPFEAE